MFQKTIGRAQMLVKTKRRSSAGTGAVKNKMVQAQLCESIAKDVYKNMPCSVQCRQRLELNRSIVLDSLSQVTLVHQYLSPYNPSFVIKYIGLTKPQ